MMERVFVDLRLFPGTEERFDRHHGRAPLEFQDACAEARMRNVTIFRRGTDAWCYGEAEGTTSDALDALTGSAAYARWRSQLIDVVTDPPEGGALVPYREVFHSDGPPLPPPFERGLFVLVVHPERIAEYDARHTDPWPEMLSALADSGFRNYSGFRNGSLVAYYGEFYPDMSRALAKIGATDVNRRWSDSFRGIITTITDDEARLFTAREILHLSGPA
jgi:L-rhamnose mutarotase